MSSTVLNSELEPSAVRLLGVWWNPVAVREYPVARRGMTSLWSSRKRELVIPSGWKMCSSMYSSKVCPSRFGMTCTRRSAPSQLPISTPKKSSSMSACGHRPLSAPICFTDRPGKRTTMVRAFAVFTRRQRST